MVKDKSPKQRIREVSVLKKETPYLHGGVFTYGRLTQESYL